MASIKIPYTYKKYEFSEEATKYSKKLGKRKYSTVGTCVVTGMVAVIPMALIAGSLRFLPDGLLLFLCLAVPIMIGVILGIKIDRSINDYYLKKRDAALRRDLNAIAGDRAEEIFQRITKEDKPKKKTGI